MKPRFACYLMLAFFVGGFLACGDSDDEQEAQPTPTVQTTSQQEPVIALPEVDFDAERTAIEEVIALHAKAVKSKKVNDIMSHWLKAESDEVFMTLRFLAANTCESRWSDVKKAWAGQIQLGEHLQIPTTIEEIGIDKRGKNATLRGKQENGTNKYEAALRKDKKGAWKIRALGFLIGHKFNNCQIKWIETPK